MRRHICSDPGNSPPQVTSFCVFQCLVWQLDRSEVLGSGLFWFGSITERPIFKGKERARSPNRLCTGFWMKYWNHDDHDHGHDYHEE